MFFSSFKKIGRFISKGMSNIYLQLIIEKIWGSQNIDFLNLKFVSRSIFGKSKARRYHWIFKTSYCCCNLKIRGLKAKLCVVFLLFEFWKELWRFKIKESVHFVEQKKNLSKTKRNQKWKNLHTVLERTTLLFSSYKSQIKSKTDELELSYFVSFIWSKRNFLTFAFYLNV